MAKLTLKGIVKQVKNEERVGAKAETRKQSLILTVPAFVDAFGDKRGNDEEWSLDLLNERIDQFNLNTSLHGKKVVAEIYISSQRIISNKDNSEMHIINARLAKLEVYQAQPTTQQTNQAPSNGW